MSSYFARLWQNIKFVSKRRLVGKDLQGNSFYETITSTDVDGTPRTRRTVQYRGSDSNDREAWRAAEKMHSIPVQWTSWLSHSRQHPPTIEELANDQLRQQTLAHNVAILNAQDDEERRRQFEALAQLQQQQQQQRISPSSSSEPSLGRTPAPESESEPQTYAQSEAHAPSPQRQQSQQEAPPPKPIGPTAEPQSWIPSPAQRGQRGLNFGHGS